MLAVMLTRVYVIRLQEEWELDLVTKVWIAVRAACGYFAPARFWAATDPSFQGEGTTAAPAVGRGTPRGSKGQSICPQTSCW